MQASNSSLTNTKDSNQTIPTVTASTTNNGNDPVKLTANTWGYNFTTGNKTGVTDNTAATWLPIPATAKSIKTTTIDSPAAGDSYYLTYGVNVPKVDNTMIKTGSYTTTITYTATAKIPAPTITKLTPNTAQLATTADSTTKLTITGTNLSTATKAWIDLDKDKAYDETEKCTIQGTPTDTSLACNLPNGSTITAGQYDVYVETQGGTSTAGTNTKFTYTPASDFNQSHYDNATVEWDKAMIPVVYTGSTSGAKWHSITDAEASSNKVTSVSGVSQWFNYTNKQWANVVTVANDKVSSYKNQSKEVSAADVLGYWVYIPRYRYQVMRLNATDTFVSDTQAKANGGFNIEFQSATDTKYAPTCSAGSSATVKECAWATHPAFSFGSTELNGIWVGKFETTGTRTNPTIKPNQQTNISESVGNQFTMAKSIGVSDSNATGGNTISGSVQNSHNLSEAKSHMLKNSEWGAVAYLSASKYGAGVNNTQINSADLPSSGWNKDGDGDNAYAGVTGCGPNADGDSSAYTPGTQLDATNIESDTACSKDGKHAYNQEIGQLASTTNNVYGIYDMSGGALEYVMGALSTSTTQVANNYSTYYGTAMKPPYVDLYPTSIFTNNDAYTSNNQCTWTTCGGQALHETKNVQSVSSYYESWGGGSSDFVSSGLPWFRRGGASDSGSHAGLFSSSVNYGGADYTHGFRAALLASR